MPSMPGMGRGGHIPYRGEVRPKLYGHPSPPKPIHHIGDQIFWFILVVIGIIIFWFNIIAALGENFRNFPTFLIYLLFFIVMIFAYRDSKKIKMITPDEDESKVRHPNDEEGQPSLLEDYITQVEWTNTHRKRHHPSHWSAPEPKWQYHAIKITSDKAIRNLLKKDHRLFWISLMIGMFIFFTSAMIFGLSSPITAIAISITCLAFLANYLIRD